MGSFNGVCHLTGLTIGYNEPIALFILRKNDFSCYPWNIISLPYYGIYNNYGFIDLVYNEEVVDANNQSKRIKLSRLKDNRSELRKSYGFMVVKQSALKQLETIKKDSFKRIQDALDYVPNVDDVEEVFREFYSFERKKDYIHQHVITDFSMINPSDVDESTKPLYVMTFLLIEYLFIIQNPPAHFIAYSQEFNHVDMNDHLELCKTIMIKDLEDDDY